MFIAVSQRTYGVDAYQEEGDYLDRRWHLFFKVIGAIPLLIPNDLELASTLLARIPIHGVLLTGGDDDVARVDVESFLLEYAIQKSLPLVGVCHGMHIIQRHYGVQLYPCEGHICEKQTILIEDEPAIVNSYHRFGTKSTVEDLMVWANSTDGMVKAIQHKVLPIFGIMWHPERLGASFLPRDIEFFKKVYGLESYHSSSGSGQPTETFN